MAFDPDKFLAEQPEQSSDFDPDAFLADPVADRLESMHKASSATPEQAARFVDLSQKSGVSYEIAKTIPDKVEAEYKKPDWREFTQAAPKTAKFLTDDHARFEVAKDDVNALREMETFRSELKKRNIPELKNNYGTGFSDVIGAMNETGAGTIENTANPEADFSTYLRGLSTSAMESLKQQGIAASLMIGRGLSVGDKAENASLEARQLQQYSGSKGASQAATPRFDTKTAEFLYGGASSFVQNAPGMAIGLAAPPVGLAIGATQSGLGQSGDILERGGSTTEALAGGTANAIVEAGTEYIPIGFASKYLGDMKVVDYVKALAGREMLGEQTATVLQDAINTAIANPGMTWKDYWEARPEAAVQTMFAVGTMSGSMGVVQAIANKASNFDSSAQSAQDHAQRISDELQIISNTKLAKNSPQTLHQYLDAIDGDEVTDLYVDPKSLFQGSVSKDAFLQAVPSAAAQIDEAERVGGLIRIPKNELLVGMATANDPAMQAEVVRHLKADAGADSLAELETRQEQIGDEMLALANEQIAKQKNAEELKNKQDELHKTIMQDLGQAGDKAGNQWRAALWAAKATATAAQVGMEPMDFYRQNFGAVTNEALGGQVLNQYAGVNAQGADLTALHRAKQQIDAGADPEQVRQETGWHKWEDGKWRFEIDDSQMRVIGLDNKSKLSDVKRGSSAVWGLPAMIDHPALFRAYPFLNDITVAVSKNFGNGGSYIPKYKQIEVGYSNNDGINKDTLLHEIQHAIQEHEGFAAGGAASDFMSPATNDLMAKKAAASEKISAINAQLKTATGEEYQRLLGERSALVADAQIDSIDIMQNAHDQYKKLAGEVEARDTASRAGMSEADRRASQPYVSQGIPDDQVIVRNSAGVMQHSEAQKAKKFTTRLVQALRAIGKDSDSFRYKTSKQKEFEKVLNDMDLSGFTVERDMRYPHNPLVQPNYGTKKPAIVVKRNGEEYAVIYDIESKTPHMEIGVRDHKEKGIGGANLYMAVAVWAKNNGKVMAYDPERLTAINFFRRTEMAISDNMRHLDSNFIPDPMQFAAQLSESERLFLETGGMQDRPRLASIKDKLEELKQDFWDFKDWHGLSKEEIEDIRLNNLAIASAALAFKRVPQLLSMRLGDDGQIYDNTGNRITRETYPSRVGGVDAIQRSGVGYLSAKRALLTRHALSGDSIGTMEELEYKFDQHLIDRNLQGATGSDLGDGAGLAAVKAIRGSKTFNQGNQVSARGSFNPLTRTIAIFQKADLSTFLHESGHLFLEIQVDMAMRESASESLKKDTDSIMRWFGMVGETPAERLSSWKAMTLDQQRKYHERFAESFEQYLFEGKAPSLELRDAFRTFRQWLTHVYKSLAHFINSHDGAKLNDDVRSVFDRMLATEEQIQAAEAARGMVPFFKEKPDSMTTAEWSEYTKAAEEATQSAIDQLASRSLRDLKWARNATNKRIKAMQREAAVQRREARMDARRMVLSQNIYRAWQFLTAPVEGQRKATSKSAGSAEVDPSRDSLLTAIAKLGGLNKDQAASQFGIDPSDYHLKGGVFGKPVLRKDGGLSPDAMSEALSQYGYMKLDENGKWDAQDLDDMLREEAAGNPQHSALADFDVLLGEPVRAPDAADVDFMGGRISRQAVREMFDDGDLAAMQGGAVDTDGKLMQGEKYTPDLFVAHNLTEENLKHADELGGLAAPSLGVSRTTTGGFAGFGEITLLADKSMLTDRDARTFDADVYSPRHPRAVHKIDGAAVRSFESEINSNQGKLLGMDARLDTDNLERRGLDELLNNEALKNYYLVSKGITITPKLKKVEDAVKKAIKYLDKTAKYPDAYNSYNLRDKEWFIKLANEHYASEFEKWKDTKKFGVREFTPEELLKYGPYEADGSLKSYLPDQLARKVESYYKTKGQDSYANKTAIDKKFRDKNIEAGFIAFAEEKFSKISTEKRLVKYTRNGNAKYSPYNLENIVAEMTRELQGGEGFNYGAGSVRSAFAFEFKHNTIESIKSFKGSIVSKDEMDKIRTEANDRLGDALDKLKKFYKYDSSSFGYANDASSAIAEGPKGQAEAFRMTAESKAIIKDLVDYLRALPSEYFETKMQRAVGIGEFAAAIVPKGTDQKTIDILQRNGIQRIEFYKSGDKDARTKAIAKQKDLLFQKGGNDSSKNNIDNMLSDDGLHPDTVADLFGLSSGDELIRKLMTLPDPVSEIDRLTDQIMLERHADLSSPEAMREAAEAAIHNEARARFVATELAMVNRAAGKPRLLVAQAKEYAAQIVSNTRVRDLKPAQYEAAEANASRAAMQEMAKGNTAAAGMALRNRFLHNVTTKAVRDAKVEMDKALTYLKKFDKPNKKIDIDYQEQIDTLLERYDLRQRSLKQIDRSKNLAQWMQEQKDMGLEPVIPDKLLDEAKRTNYKDLTVEEMRGLVDAVKNIEHLGRLKNRLLTDKARRELNALADSLGESVAKYGGSIKPVKLERNTTVDKLSDLASGFFSMHRKLASIVRQLDGWKDGGLFWETMIRPMNEAGDNEAVMHEQSTLALAKVFAPLKGRKLTKKLYIPMIATSLSLEGRLAVALNWGNEGNRQRLMDGDKWGVGEVNAILATLTAEDWKFVQGVWDHIATYKDAIGAQQKRLTGVEPTWVEATPFEIKTADGQTVQVQGGYYPAKYDTTRSTQALANEAAGNVFDQWKAAKGQGKTRDGFTKSRASQVIDRPLRKDFGVITQHITEVTHRLAWQDWVVDMNRLLKKEQVDSAIRAHYGNEILEEMRKAIEDITTGDMTAQSSFEKAINHLRIGTTIVGLGYNLTTSLLQPFGLTQSMVRIGPKWVAKGLSTWIGNPTKMNARTEEVYAKSPFMRLRGKTMMREMNEILNSVRKEKMSRIEASYFYGIQKMQIIADMPTWLGQYEKSMAEFDGDEEKAIALADQAVLDAQGGGQNKDLSRIQRGGPLLKLWTNFYSFFNTTYNLTRESVGRTDMSDPASVAKLGIDMLLLYSVPSVMGTLLKAAIMGGDDDDDDDELAGKLIRDQMSYLFGTMVGLREISAAFSGFNGYQGPAGTRFFSEVAKFGKQAEQGEADAPFLKSLNNIGGMLFHYPAGQINRTVEGANALMDGETDNYGALIFGKPR